MIYLFFQPWFTDGDYLCCPSVEALLDELRKCENDQFDDEGEIRSVIENIETISQGIAAMEQELTSDRNDVYAISKNLGKWKAILNKIIDEHRYIPRYIKKNKSKQSLLVRCLKRNYNSA